MEGMEFRSGEKELIEEFKNIFIGYDLNSSLLNKDINQFVLYLYMKEDCIIDFLKDNMYIAQKFKNVLDSEKKCNEEFEVDYENTLRDVNLRKYVDIRVKSNVEEITEKFKTKVYLITQIIFMLKKCSVVEEYANGVIFSIRKNVGL